jgi:hypothetical protein
LLDPSRKRRYQRGGVEVETGVAVAVPWDRAIELGNTTIVHSPFIKLVLDQATGLDDTPKVIFEIVSHPTAMVDGDVPVGDRHRDRDLRIAAARGRLLEVQLAVLRLKRARPGVTLGEIFTRDRGYTIMSEEFERWVILGEIIPNKMGTQYSVGVWLGAMREFMKFVAKRSYVEAANPAMRHLRSSFVFGDQVAAAFVGLPESEALEETLDKLTKHDLELGELRNFMGAVYTQFAAFLHYHVMQPENQRAKNYTLIAFRTALGGMRTSLPESARTWLDENSDVVERIMTERFSADNPGIAHRARTTFGALLNTTDSAAPWTARDYLQNSTKRLPRVFLSQYDALNIRKDFLTMDWRASNLPDCGPNRVRFGKDSRNWQGNTRNTSPSFVTR